nr:hypothetical protein Ade03nite_02060 [Actinoplanes derwentensis]
MIEMGRRLEAGGLRLCCQTAWRNVWPSGQLRQFSNGRQGHVLTEARRSGVQAPFETVDLLDVASQGHVVCMDEQYRFVRAFHGLPPIAPTPNG